MICVVVSRGSRIFPLNLFCEESMSDDTVNGGRRRFLTSVTTTVGVAGAAVAVVPFVYSMTPAT